MKNDKSKRTIFALLCLYIAIGIVVVILFSVYGSKISRHRLEVEYTFTDDGKVGEHLEADSVNVIGESGAKEEAVEEVVVEEPETVPQEKVFYKFTVTTEIHRLRIRRDPSLLGIIIGHLEKGEVAYVLEKGEKWSYITNGTYIGYCSNEYMDMTEISIDELPDYYPDEYKVLSTEEIKY